MRRCMEKDLRIHGMLTAKVNDIEYSGFDKLDRIPISIGIWRVRVLSSMEMYIIRSLDRRFLIIL